jgi:hypothetical protein
MGRYDEALRIKAPAAASTLSNGVLIFFRKAGRVNE